MCQISVGWLLPAGNSLLWKAVINTDVSTSQTGCDQKGSQFNKKFPNTTRWQPLMSGRVRWVHCKENCERDGGGGKMGIPFPTVLTSMQHHLMHVLVQKQHLPTTAAGFTQFSKYITKIQKAKQEKIAWYHSKRLIDHEREVEKSKTAVTLSFPECQTHFTHWRR